MKIYLLLFLIIVLSNCEKRSSQNPTLPAEKRELTYEQALYLIEEHRDFELQNNRDFYNTLSKESNQYFSDITREFLEKEYSLSGSFSEIGLITKKTPEERFVIWEAKLNSYFSTLAYVRFVKSITQNHSKNLNKQRKEDLEKILKYINEDSLKIKKVSLYDFQASEELVSQCIKESNKKIKENLRTLAYDAAAAASLVTTGGTSGVVILSVEGAGMTEMTYSLVVPGKNKTREILEKEYASFLEKNRIDFTEILNENTNNYYDKLHELINNRKNEKIFY